MPNTVADSYVFAFQTSASKIGTLQQDVSELLRGFLSNSIQPELLAATPDDQIHTIENANVANQLSDDEMGIGTATRMNLTENADELEDIGGKQTCFCQLENSMAHEQDYKEASIYSS